MRYAITTTGGLISIEQYAAAPDPPQGLTCPGRAPDGSPCRREVVARALDSRLVRPYFRAERAHIAGCDEGASATERRTGATRDGSTIARTPRGGPELVLIDPNATTGAPAPRTSTGPAPGAARRISTAVPGAPRTTRPPGRRRMSLTGLLARLLDHRLDPRALIELPDGTTGPARRLVRRINTLTAADAGLRACHYGTATDQQPNDTTRSIFLHVRPRPRTSPRATAAIMITADQAPAVQDHLDASIGDLAGHHVIVIGTLRVARRSRNLSIRLDDPDSIAHLP